MLQLKVAGSHHNTNLIIKLKRGTTAADDDCRWYSYAPAFLSDRGLTPFRRWALRLVMARCHLGLKRFARSKDDLARCEREAVEYSLQDAHVCMFGDSVENLLAGLADQIEKEWMTFALDDGEESKSRGNEAFREGDYDAAIAHYTDALRHRPHWAIVWANRCNCHLKLGEYHEALYDAFQCTDLDGGWWKGHVRLGEALLACKQPRHALEEFADAEELVGQGGKEIIEYIRKQVDLAQDYLDQEELLWDETMPRSPHLAEMRRQRDEERTREEADRLEEVREMAEAAMVRREYEAVINMLTEALDYEQYSADLYAFRLQAYIACAETERRPEPLARLQMLAEADAQRLLELEHSTPAFCFAADFCERVGRLEQARELFAHSIDIGPALPAAVEGVCSLVQELHRGTEGLSARVKAVIAEADLQYELQEHDDVAYSLGRDESEEAYCNKLWVDRSIEPGLKDLLERRDGKECGEPVRRPELPPFVWHLLERIKERSALGLLNPECDPKVCQLGCAQQCVVILLCNMCWRVWSRDFFCGTEQF